MSAGLPPLPHRRQDVHKGDLGRVVLVAGSRGMAGATVLAAEAAFRVGVGYVVIVAPGGMAPELTVALPAAILALQGEPDRTHLRGSDLSCIQETYLPAQALAVGPGLGQHADTVALVQALFDTARPATVLDADALNALAQTPRPLSAETVLTPHPGEAARLLGLESAASIQEDRAASLSQLVNQYGSVVVLKGADTLVGAPEKETWPNETGNAGMATAGSGDVLTGVIAGLMCRGLAPWDAARVGAHLHGVAGDLARDELGEDALLASDLLRFLPQAMQNHPQEDSS